MTGVELQEAYKSLAMPDEVQWIDALHKRMRLIIWEFFVDPLVTMRSVAGAENCTPLIPPTDLGFAQSVGLNKLMIEATKMLDGIQHQRNWGETTKLWEGD